MPPEMQADLHKQGLLSGDEAMYIYDKDGRVVANLKALIKDGEPVF